MSYLIILISLVANSNSVKAQLSASISAQTNVLCHGDATGSLTATASMGAANYTYEWSTGATTSNTASTTDMISGLAAGTYTVTITDNTASTSTASATITQPASALGITGPFATGNVSCNGGSDGSATVFASGGTSPYSYSWTNGNTNQSPNDLAAGTHTVTVTDNNGCTTSGALFTAITEPAALTVIASTTADVLCNGDATGSTNSVPSGGTTPYTYLWTGGSTTAAASSLVAGTYTITITDANGCTTTDNTVITEPASALVANSSVTSNVSCNGDNDGAVTSAPTGGTTPYTYLWNTGATSASVSSLTAATYTITVTDANGCTATGTATPTEPAALVAGASVTSDVSCNGDNDGSVTSSPTGGTTPYTYLWNTGATSASVSSLTAATYTITVTDANGCTATGTATPTEPAVLAANASVSADVDCNGNSTGSVTSSPTGGTTPYTYSWSSGGSSATETGLTAATYTVTVTDANGCTATGTATPTEPTALSVAASTTADVDCNGNSTGSTNSVPSGGTSPYTYSWSDGQTTAAATSLTATTYTITVTDANGCTATDNTIVNEPTVLVASATTDSNAPCNGAFGSVSVSGSGGTTPYSYLWNTGATGTGGPAPANTYTITITDANGCTATDNTTITEPAVLLSNGSVVSNVSCNGGSDGSVTSSPTGGTTPYTYAWSSGGSSATETGLTAATYTITVTDANGCTETSTATVTEPTALAAVASVVSNVSCNGGSDGSVTSSPTGGTTPYTYSWSSGGSSATETGLTATTYTVTVTDANGCTATGTATPTEPAALVAGASVSADVDCNGNSTGSVTSSPSGGTTPYTYSWSSGGSSATETGLAAATYTVTVTDANGCTATGTATPSEPTVLTVTASTTANVDCNGDATGSVNSVPTGGTTPYTYVWSNGGNSAAAASLSAGTHTITVTDANGCTATDNTTITEPAVLLSNGSVVSNVSCNGGSDGSVTSSPTGGTTPYTYAWSSGGSSATETGLTAATYTITVTDANGCTETSTATVTEPTALAAVASVVSNVSCNGGSDGSVTSSPTGGTTPYTYSWSSGGSSATETGLTATTYTVTVTDANGCTATGTATPTEPAALVAGASVSADVDCNGNSTGSVTSSPSGGTTPYTYSWSSGGSSATETGLAAATYTVTVTDANGCTATGTATPSEPTVLTVTASTTANVDCNGDATGSVNSVPTGGTTPYTYVWSNGGNSAAAASLSAGTHTITVTDANGCTATDNTTITEPAVLLSNGSVVSNVSCNGGSDGSVTSSPTGGTTPYTYAWSSGGSSATETGLTAATYTITVTDANGCTETSTATVTEPTALAAVASVVSNVSCNGGSDGSVTSSPTGGTTPYTYSWSSGGSSATETGLTATTYTVTVTDANGCTATGTATPTEPAALVAGASVSADVDCNGNSTGSVTSSPSGGTTPYTYSWSSGGSSATETGLAAATYTVTVTDANGCTATGTATPSEPTVLTVTASTTANVDCNGDATGSVNSVPTGGTTPYTYVWSNGGNSAAAASLSAGTHTITVTDANGCTATDNTTITEPAVLLSNGSVVSNVSCNGGSDGSVTSSPTGGTTPYTYAWSSGGSSATETGLTAATYTITVTDANGCTETSTATVTEPTALASVASVVSNVSCNGGSDGSVTSSPTGGTTPYTYSWSSGGSSATETGLTATTYTVTVTDANGCTATGTASPTEPTTLSVTASTTADVDCNGASTGSTNATPSGGTMPYTYNWSDGQTTVTATSLLANTYTITVTDANGCTATDNTVVNEPTVLAAGASVTANVSCNAGSDGSASSSPSGGTTPYSYLWSSGETTAAISSKIAGTYTITVTDANGCTDTETASITEPVILGVSITSQTNNVTNGGMIGAATAAGSGGTTPYTYSWSTGEAVASISGKAAGSYVVSVNDANGCGPVTTIVNITEPGVLSATTTVTDVDCNGGSTGSASASPSGGITPYTYTWSSGETVSSISSKMAGTYTVTIDDNAANGPITRTVIINEPTAVTANITAQTNIDCNGNSTGSATGTGSGGTAPYTYAWNSGETVASISSKVAGTYTVSVTDANGCGPATTTVILTEPTALSVVASTTADVDCNGNATGSANSVPSGGTMPYTYSWSDGQSTAAATGLAANTYTITVTDANGCTATDNTVISEPVVLVASAIVDSNVTCTGFLDGGGTASATGGTTPYTYSWNNTAITASITGVAASTYYVTITDANGCTDSASISITEPSVLAANASVAGNVSCNGGSDGSVTSAPTGGTMPYTYNWSNAATTATATSLIVGTYTVTVTDNNGCTATGTASPIEPTAVTASITAQTNIDCNGNSTGSATGAGSGGTSPYTYTWNSGETVASISSKVAGTYTVSVTDANGCGPATTTVILTEPTALSVVASTTADVDCNGNATGSANSVPSGGTMPYTYSWSDGQSTAAATGLAANTYTITVTDANGCTATDNTVITEPVVLVASAIVDSNATCNGFLDGGGTASATGGTTPYTYSWNNTATTASITGVAAATYYVTVTDANGCTDSTNVTITEPATLIASAIVDSNVSCNGFFDGGGTASGTGGTMPYTYNWNNAATTASITGVAAATYYVTITDANGCTDSTNMTITEPIAITATITAQTNIDCNGNSTGSATGAGSGGTSPYTYQWSSGEAVASISSKVAGTYTVSVTDANGCGPATTTVTLTEPTALSVTASTSAVVDCNGNATGSANSVPSGGTMPYTYSWSDGQSTAAATGLAANTYTITVTDANGCTATDNTVITEPVVLVASAIVDSNATCNGFLDGGGTASATGGTTPYTYSWNNTATTASITGVAAATYYVTVTDANGCTDSTNLTITEPATLIASAVVDSNVSCNGFSDGGGTASGTGGTMPYTYNWSNTATTASITGVTSSTYYVTITDANGCTDSASLFINEPVILVASAALDDHETCVGASDGGVSGSATGGTMPYTYNWSNAATTAIVTGLTSGTYTVTVTDANGCTDIASTAVTVLDTILPNVIANDTTLYLDVNGMVSVTAAGINDGSSDACGILSMEIDSTSFDCSEVGANTIEFKVTDVNGNADSVMVTVTVEDTVRPVVVIKDTTLYLDVNGMASITANDIDNGSTDACGIQSISLDSTDFDCSEVGANTVTLYVTDDNNNTDSAIATVTILDTIRPIVVANDTTLYLDVNGMVSVTAEGIDDGSSDNCGIMTYALDSTNFDCSEVGANTVTLYITDNNNNIDSITATVTVLDTIRPMVVANDTTLYLDVNGQASVTAAGINDGSTDACGILSMEIDSTSFDCSEVGANTITFRVTDVNGNIDSVDVTVTVLDTILPTVIANDTTLYLDANGQASVTAAGIDDGSNDACGIQTREIDISSFGCGEVGANTVEFKVTDVNGNVDSVDVTVTVLDTVLPVVLANDTTLYLDANGTASVTAAGINDGSNDACGIQTIEIDSSNFDCSEVGTNTVEFKVTDVNGNADSTTVTVTVLDTISPVITSCPSDISVTTDAGVCGATVSWTVPIESDNCQVDSLVSNFNPGDFFPTGVTEVIYTAYDPSLNTTVCRFTITVTDNEDPILANIPADITVNTDAGNCDAVVSWTPPTSSDNCAISSVTSSHNPGDVFVLGTTTVEYIAFDTDQNTDTITFTITVEDNELPTITCPPDTVLCDSVFTYTVPTGADNCGVQSVLQSSGLASGSAFPYGVTTNTFVITDDNGNVDSCSFTVTVSTPPIVDAGPDTSVFKDDGVNLSVNVTSPDGVMGYTYLWESPLFSADIDDPMTPSGTTKAFPDEDTEFSVLVTNSLGCEASDTFNVTIDASLTIPTAFTPDDDFVNDTWDIKNTEEFASVEVVVVNGLGKEVLNTTDYKPWDGRFEGTDLPVGSYYYVIKIEDNNGRERVETGMVTILR